jgi:predicted MFS family arabinose efflux permease
MNFLRNTFAILVGLSIVALMVTVGIRMVPEWRTFDGYSPFEHWNKFLQSMQGNSRFFWFLLCISGLGTTIAGIATAIIVKYAKVAYAILIGFIMLFVAMVDIIIFPHHPTFYKILIFLIYFPFAWIGGKIVEVLYNKRNSPRNKNKNAS